MGDTIIEDFIEKKLDELAAKLFNELPIENPESNTSEEITERDNAKLKKLSLNQMLKLLMTINLQKFHLKDETIVEDPDKSESSDDR